MEFYAIGAQVIPVFFLAMAFESRTLYRQPDSYDPEDKDNPARWDMTQIVLVIYVAALMAAGEVAALAGLYNEIEHRIINMLVWYGLLAGLLGVVWPVLSYQWKIYKRKLFAGDHWFVIFMTILLLITISSGLALFFWL